MSVSWAMKEAPAPRRLAPKGIGGDEWADFREPLTEWLQGLSVQADLDRMVLRLERAGTPVACQDDDAGHLSEDQEERAVAAALCQDCPVRGLCDKTASVAGYTFGVWGGQDRTEPEEVPEDWPVCAREGCTNRFPPSVPGVGAPRRYCAPTCRPNRGLGSATMILKDCQGCGQEFVQPRRHGKAWAYCEECRPVRVKSHRPPPPHPVDGKDWVIKCLRCPTVFRQPVRKGPSHHLCQKCFDKIAAAGQLSRLRSGAYR